MAATPLRVADIVAFEPKGWDLVAANVSPELASSLEARARRVTKIGEGRFSMELPLEVAPERLLAEVAARGGTVVSLNPIRETLEDFFVRQVAASGSRQEADTAHRSERAS